MYFIKSYLTTHKRMKL